MKQRKEQIWAREGSGDLTPVHKYLVGRRREGGARLSSAVSSDGTGHNGHRLKHRKFSLNTRKKGLFLFGFALFSCCEGGQTMARVSQRGYGVSWWRDAHSPAACILSPEAPAHLGNPSGVGWCNHKVPTPWISSPWEHQARW